MIDVAFRAHENADWMRVAQDDVLRVIDDRVVVVANAFAHGFASFWPKGSRVVLDLFVDRWTATNDLEAAMAHVRAESPTRAMKMPAAAIAPSARETLEKLPRDKFECVIFVE